MSTRVLDQEEEEDTISTASSLSEAHSEEEEESDEDSTTEAEAEAIQQATEKERQYLISKYAIQIPDKQKWIASWFEKRAGPSSGEKRRAVSGRTVNLYGYYKKKKRVGGYGVIFRDPSGKPVRASVHSSRGGSYLYYLLKGLRKGLRLAIASGRLHDGRVIVRCNSDRLERLIRGIIRTPTPYCRRRHHKTRKICKKCTRIALYDIGSGEFKQLYRILKDIVKMGKGFESRSGLFFDVVCMSRADNKAAYYLAKHFKKRRKELKPQEFPQELRDIVWEDAYGGCMTYSVSSWMTKFHQKQGEA